MGDALRNASQPKSIAHKRAPTKASVAPMLRLCSELGFTTRMVPDEPGVAQITLHL